jgi:hypothetical protein
MTDRPEDYAQPKHRQANPPAPAEQPRQRINEEHEAELVRKVEGALSEVKQAENKVQDFGALGAQAILKYAEASAMTCEQTGTEVMADAQRLRDECMQLAEDIRHVARLQAQAVQRAMDRNKEAAQGITALRKAFHDDISKERAEVEASKQRASS